MSNHFGDKIKLLRNEKSLFQRQVAVALEIDSPMLSKIERGERRAKKEQVLILAKLFKVKQEDLLSLWLADQLYEILEGEPSALKAMQLTEDKVKYDIKSKNGKG